MNKMKRAIGNSISILLAAILFLACGFPDSSAESIFDFSKLPSSSPAAEFFQKRILPKFDLEGEEQTVTYYCQTCGKYWEDSYLSTTSSNFYAIDNFTPWLLAWHIADYDSDGIDDLFVISLDNSGHSEPYSKNGKDKEAVYIYQTLYLINNDGTPRYTRSEALAASATEEKRIFAFVDDKLIDISIHDYSKKTEGREKYKVVYPVNSSVERHTASADVRMYNPETKEMDCEFSFSRTYDKGDISYDIDSQTDRSEQEAIDLIQERLGEYGITGLEIPLSSTWGNRWDECFYFSQKTNCAVFAFDSSPTVSKRCYGVERIATDNDDMNLLSTTTGENTFRRYKYKFGSSPSVLDTVSQLSTLVKSIMSQQDNPASTVSEDQGDLPVANVENASALSAYLPKAIRAREQTLQCSHLDEETINRYSRGILLDWDNDGTEELFLTYYHPKSWYDIQKVCCYDIEDGKVKAMIEDMQSEVVDATGMRGFSGITMYQGKPAVFSCAFHEYTSEMSDRKYQTVWAKFTLWDLYSKETLHKADISCDGHHLSYKIDGKPCTESDFISIIDDCSFLTYDPSPREPYMTYSLSFIPIDELIELLGGNTSAPSAKENIQAKQLSQIKRITSNGDESIITFQYDSNGRLISSTGSDDNVYTYSYDDAGHLIEVNCSYWEPYGPMYEYHYDENGFLVEVSGIGEGGGIAYTLENDAQGRVIRKTRNYDFGTAVTEYVYSDNGAHVEEVTTDTHSVGTVYQGKSTPQETTVKTASVDYTYDDRGRVLSETRTSDGKAVRTTYDYSYPPLIFVCDENGTPYRCEIRDSAGIQIWYMVIGKGSHSIERDDDGYLSGMICDDADYQFRFSCEENPDWSLARDLFDDVETEDRYHDNTTKDTSEVQYVVGYVVNAESGLNVRQNPSTSSERVRRIHNGTRVLISEQVTIDGMLWGRISDGWICMNYIKLEEEESTRGVRYVVSPSAGVVNIRCEAGTAYESIERIVSGEEVIIYSQKIVDGREWGKTDAGWICMEYLTRSP